MPPVVNNNFNPVSVELQDSNLIEASAGTGKTFSIALLVVRLVIEKGFSVSNILMVTFTNAAVAELEVRVRVFIRKTLKLAQTGDYIQAEEDPLAKIIQGAIDLHRLDLSVIIERLRQAEILLDETAVMTIHSFCQQTLTEFSFETNQLFSSTIISPDELNELIEDQFNEWWRKNITTLNLQLLETLLENKLKRETLLQGIKKVLSGQKIYNADQLSPNYLFADLYREFAQSQTQITQELQGFNQTIKNAITQNKDQYAALINKSTSSPEYKTYGEAINTNNIDFLIQLMEKKITVSYTKKIFPAELLELIQQKLDALDVLNRFIPEFINKLIVVAANYIIREIRKIKNTHGMLSYDDMIDNLYTAIFENPQSYVLKMQLRNKYKAVFIDEFQDTDKQQYGIFNAVFGDNHLLFYIGDPKQSIYAFRKADINTYLRAATEVKYLYRMNTNFRSNESFIYSMNQFFKPTVDFDTFYFSSDNKLIDYNTVNTPQPNNKGILLKNGQPTTPLLISTHLNDVEVYKSVVATIMDLLTENNYQIKKGEKLKPVRPSDIGILVREKKEAKTLKKWLSNFNIPSITIADTKVLESNEAKDLYFILEAIQEITPGNINRALLTQTGGLNTKDLLQINEEYSLQQFRSYQETWDNKGVFVMLKQFLADRDFNERCSNQQIAGAERIIANTYQLLEILHKMEQHKNYDAKELTQWLKKSIDGKSVEGDEFEQRLESDEEAVKIVTIHKSKGLEYTIVLAPFLDLKNEKPAFNTIDYRNPENGEYYNASKKIVLEREKQWSIIQAEQENRRLLYVAITRACLQCFIFSDNSKAGKSTVQVFLRALNVPSEVDTTIMGDGWEKWLPPEINPQFSYSSSTANLSANYAVAKNFRLLQPNWKKTSYSGLSPDHITSVYSKQTEQILSEYDQFVFKELKKGAHTGNLLHFIFENIQFNQPQNWPKVVEKALNRLTANPNSVYIDKIISMLEQVMSVQIPVQNLSASNQSFSLSELSWENRLTELEFDFPLQPFSSQQIKAFSTSDTPFHIKNYDEIEGIMNGKIDLFFKMHNKYYILDWKSNHLGFSLDDYRSDKLTAAMGEHNYHLQYHLYTIAAYKYLSQCLPDFNYDKDFGGVIYLFLRGVRNGYETGIFLSRPDKEKILQLQEVF